VPVVAALIAATQPPFDFGFSAGFLQSQFPLKFSEGGADALSIEWIQSGLTWIQ
jgi:hypothetical protein